MSHLVGANSANLLYHVRVTQGFAKTFNSVMPSRDVTAQDDSCLQSVIDGQRWQNNTVIPREQKRPDCHGRHRPLSQLVQSPPSCVRTSRPESSEETRASLSPRFPPCATEPSEESYVAPSGIASHKSSSSQPKGGDHMQASSSGCRVSVHRHKIKRFLLQASWLSLPGRKGGSDASGHNNSSPNSAPKQADVIVEGPEEAADTAPSATGKGSGTTAEENV
ncbi:hypothetical protein HPB50_010580 [Hyalomma asiaticum]|uniref:Uncharacterized protein n=1 Tax=Hyalomma asiaticum TaxID=266040 RepID=A0ACB7STN9_HYAAI|nr:hypothetical protein HPB50_010580 [Hyalomma asiaticum]